MMSGARAAKNGAPNATRKEKALSLGNLKRANSRRCWWGPALMPPVRSSAAARIAAHIMSNGAQMRRGQGRLFDQSWPTPALW
jgi:hypothetical protein